ncbi:MAG TPA: hypothetical protein VN788_13260 [Verrucomicrobiae bacterium]|nr:hypothetical protein [Verrucomicrobiae bacterium]
MGKPLAAVYISPVSGMPKIAAIVQDGQVTYAQTVADEVEGKVLLSDMLAILDPPNAPKTKGPR